MNTPAIAPYPENKAAEAKTPLRFDQRTSAALIEHCSTDDAADVRIFRPVRPHGVARRTLSVLSADDHGGLQRWLALQLASRGLREGGPGRNRNSLSRVDAMLSRGGRQPAGRDAGRAVPAQRRRSRRLIKGKRCDDFRHFDAEAQQAARKAAAAATVSRIEFAASPASAYAFRSLCRQETRKCL